MITVAAGCASSDHPNGSSDSIEDPEADFITHEVTVSAEIPTVVVVDFRVDLPGPYTTAVKHGATSDCLLTARAHEQEEGDFRAYLLGAKPDSEVWYQIIVEKDDAVYTTGLQSTTTGPLPNDLPRMSAEILSPDNATEGYLVTSLISVDNTSFVQAIFDRDGDYVWFHEVGDPCAIVARARLSRDGTSMLYLLQTERHSSCSAEEPTNYIVRVSLDGRELESIPAGHAHHDFTELPDGTIAVPVVDIQEIDGELIAGETIVEIKPDGSPETVWSSWDTYDPELPAEFVECEWGHANSIQYEEAEDAYYLGLALMSSIWKIERATGEVIWKLGSDPDSSSFSPADEDTRWFKRQHGIDLTESGIMVFDNEGTEFSRAVEYELDEDAMQAKQIWEHASEEQFYTYALGDVQRLPSGSTLITWSVNGQVDVVTEGHEVTWRLNAPMGTGFAYSTWVTSLDAL